MNKRLLVFIILSTIILSIPRFGHQTPDSIYYIYLAQFFDGVGSGHMLIAPYAYRILLPLLVSYGPTPEYVFNFAIINLLCTILAYIVFFYYSVNLMRNQYSAILAVTLLIFSFPTINYSSSVLTDAFGFLFLITSVFFLQRKKYLFFSIFSALGVIAREANLILLLILVFSIIFISFEKRSFKPFLLSLWGLPMVSAYFAVRAYFPNIEHHVIITREQFISNILRPISWITVILSIFPILLLAILITKENRKNLLLNIQLFNDSKRLIAAITIAGCILYIFSVFSAFMSGRFVWPLYLVLIPAISLLMSQTSIYEKKVLPVFRRYFKV